MQKHPVNETVPDETRARTSSAITAVIIGWVLLLVLFWLGGQFLEGAPYRVIVRSEAFIAAALALSVYGAVYGAFFANRLLPLHSVLVVYAIVSWAGFIWAVQHYYHGGKNADYYHWLVFWSALQLINLALFSAGLLLDTIALISGRKPFGRLSKLSGGQLKSQAFYVSLHQQNEQGGAGRTIKELSGDISADNPLPQVIFVDGYSQDQAIDLRPYWQRMQEQNQDALEEAVTLYETIIKFGEAQQLVSHYWLTFSLK